jgi:hypothetical protein
VILVATAAAAAVFLVLLATLAFRPALLLGIEGDALAHSVDSRLPSIGDPGHCERQADGGWTCHVLFEDDPGSGGGYVVYDVVAGSLGCWQARLPASARSGDRLPGRMHGCIYLWDF